MPRSLLSHSQNVLSGIPVNYDGVGLKKHRTHRKTTGGHLIKGSIEAKEHMAALRSMKGKKHHTAHHPHTMHGEGFFQDVGNFLKDTVQQALPAVIGVLAKSHLGGGLKKHRKTHVKKHGSGIFHPGMHM